MENKIKLLPEIVANQIAAGEVVDNPSSVVKEMMENAIDAGAKSVKVNFRNAGLELIQIIDDGCGMSLLDARMAFDRHATSKIASFDDIYKLHTFGFRGEALASIAAVAEVELRTRQAGDDIGSLTIVNGGEFVSQTPIMCPVGTQFMVRNLFYTAPARRKFSKDRTKMVGDIKKEFKRVALCNPQVTFELLSNDMSIITLPATTLSNRIIDVVGRHIKTNLLEVDVETSIVKIKGYIGRPSAAKQKNNEQYLFVNGRYFRSPQLYHSILRAYEKLIPEGCTPSYFLYLTVDADRVDVNVSPHKTEVRFADHDDIIQILRAAIRSSLAKSGGISLMDFENSVAIEIPAMDNTTRVYNEPKASINAGYNPFNEAFSNVAVDEDDIDLSAYDVPYNGVSDMATPIQSRPVKPHSNQGGLKDIPWSSVPLSGDVAATQDIEPIVSPYREISSSIMGGEFSSQLTFEGADVALQQELSTDLPIDVESIMPLAGGYAIVKYGTRVMIIDLRRAKERITYDSLKRIVSGGESASQQLLFPESLILSLDEYSVMSENYEEFVALGFDVDFMEGGEVVVRGIPSSCVGESIEGILYDLIKEVEQTGRAGEQMQDNMLRALARRSAMRFELCSAEQIKPLIEQLMNLDNYSFSPSGKVIMAEITPEFIKLKLG